MPNFIRLVCGTCDMCWLWEQIISIKRKISLNQLIHKCGVESFPCMTLQQATHPPSQIYLGFKQLRCLPPTVLFKCAAATSRLGVILQTKHRSIFWFSVFDGMKGFWCFRATFQPSVLSQRHRKMRCVTCGIMAYTSPLLFLRCSVHSVSQEG